MRALIVIDMQKGYLGKYEESLLHRINERIQHAAQNKELIVYIKNTKRLRGGRRTDELAEDLALCSSHILCKEAASAFSNEALPELLRENAVTEVTIAGVDGNACVAATALDAQKRGYRVILPCECIGVQNKERFEKKKAVLQEKGVAVL